MFGWMIFAYLSHITVQEKIKICLVLTLTGTTDINRVTSSIKLSRLTALYRTLSLEGSTFGSWQGVSLEV